MTRLSILTLTTALVLTFPIPGFALRSTGPDGKAVAGEVYTMTNAADGNTVIAMERDADGNLTFDRAYSTGGNGSGAALGNAGGMILSPDTRFLLVVNAGTNDISAFAFRLGRLRLVDRTSSGGKNPISVTMSGNVVYVLNAGGSVGGTDNVTGFKMRTDGHLFPLRNSTRPLSGASTGPAQVAFNRSGSALVVTEKTTSNIDTYAVKPNGMLVGPQIHQSAAAEPFGFAFDNRDHLIVSDAVMGNANAGGVSSYVLQGRALRAITAFAPTNQTAPCWVVVSANGRYAYASNTASGSISGFRIGFNGALSALNGGQPLGVTGPSTSGPIDMAQSHDGRYLYALDAGTQAISVFAELANGGLQSQLGVYGFPASIDGLAAL